MAFFAKHITYDTAGRCYHLEIGKPGHASVLWNVYLRGKLLREGRTSRRAAVVKGRPVKRSESNATLIARATRTAKRWCSNHGLRNKESECD